MIQMDSTVNDGLSPFLHDKNPPSGIMVQNKLLQVLAVRELWVISYLLPHLIKHVAVEITVHDSPVVDESIQLTLHRTLSTHIHPRERYGPLHSSESASQPLSSPTL